VMGRSGSVNFLLLELGQVSHLWFESGFGKFPLKIPKNFIFSLQIKNNLFGSGQQVKSILGLGQGPSHHGA